MAKVTDEQIKAWKEKHKDVYAITVDDKTGYVRKPGRKDLSFAMAASSGGKDPVKMNEALLNSCWLGGDEEFKTQDDYFFAASQKLGDLMEMKEAELKKL